MKDWEVKITEFLEKYESGNEITDESLESLVEHGINPMLLDYMAVSEAAVELAEANLKTMTAKTRPLIAAILKLTRNGEKLQ